MDENLCRVIFVLRHFNKLLIVFCCFGSIFNLSANSHVSNGTTSVLNRAPTFDHGSEIKVSEGSEIGTVVGQILVTDPDGNDFNLILPTGVKSINLADVNGDDVLDLIVEEPEGVFNVVLNKNDSFSSIEEIFPSTSYPGQFTDNHLFSIDSSGILRTKYKFDYERNESEFIIGVQAIDSFGATNFQKFKILILDEFEDFDEDGIEDHMDPDQDGDGFTDVEELAKGTNPRDSLSFPNRSPIFNEFVDINVTRNAEIGSVVGQISVSDPEGNNFNLTLPIGVKSINLADMNSDDVLDLIIEEPEGVFNVVLNNNDSFSSIEEIFPSTSYPGQFTDNYLFSIDSNGSIRTKDKFDDETNKSEFIIGVQAIDSHGGTSFQKFKIKILDEFEDLDGDGIEDHYDLDDDGDGFSDEEEIAYPSDPRDANSVANVAPDSLYLSKAEVLENQSIGTLVGLFAGNDPDGDELTYRIIPNHNADDYHDQLVQEESTRRSGTLDDYGYIDYSQLESYGYDDLGPDGMVGTGDEYMFIDPLTGEIIYSEPFGDVDLGPDGLPGTGDEYTLDGSEFDPTFYDPDYGYIDPVAEPYYDDAEIDEPYLGDFTGNDPLGDNDDYESTSVDIPFDLDENGKLTTNSELDYETDPTSYEISVEVTDPHGFSLVKEFTIKLLNEVEDLDGDGIEDHYDLDDDGDGFSDEEEIAYPSDPRDANSVANVAPDSLYLSNAEILENQPIGTIIGIFEGTDQDGDDLSYFETNNISSFEEHETILRANNGQAVVGLVDGQYRYGNLNGLTVWTVFSTTLNSSVSWRIRTGFHDNNVSYGVEGVFDQLPVEGVDSGEYLINEQGIYIWRGLLEYSIISVDNGIVRSSVKSTSSDYVGVFGDSFLFFSKEDAQSFYNAKSKGLDTESFFEEETPISVNESFRPFTLEKNGTLILTNELDFETDPSSFNVEVTVLDSHGESYQKTFKIDLLNIVEDLDGDGEEDHYDLDDDGDGFSDAVEIENSFNPRSRFNRPELALVQTLTSVYGIDNSYKLRGRLNTTGGVPLHELGFLVVGGNIDGTDLLLIDTNVTEGGEFSISLPNPVLGQSYVYRAYASNIAGSSTGSPRKFTIDESNNWWLGAEELGGGWKSNWFGSFLPQANGWTYHADLGWAFVSPDGSGGLWLWLARSGWHWTLDGTWPFIWSDNTSDRLYMMDSGNGIFLYDYSTESFISGF